MTQCQCHHDRHRQIDPYLHLRLTSNVVMLKAKALTNYKIAQLSLLPGLWAYTKHLPFFSYARCYQHDLDRVAGNDALGVIVRGLFLFLPVFNGINQRQDLVLIPQILFQGGTIQATVCREVLTALSQFRGLGEQGFQLHRLFFAFRAGRWLDAERHRDFVFSIGNQMQSVTKPGLYLLPWLAVLRHPFGLMLAPVRIRVRCFPGLLILASGSMTRNCLTVIPQVLTKVRQ